MGIMANELSLGCDCLGQIHYLVSGGMFDSKFFLIQNDVSLVALSHTTVVPSLSRTSYAFTKRIMACSGNTLITGPMAGNRPQEEGVW